MSSASAFSFTPVSAAAAVVDDDDGMSASISIEVVSMGFAAAAAVAAENSAGESVMEKCHDHVDEHAAAVDTDIREMQYGLSGENDVAVIKQTFFDATNQQQPRGMTVVHEQQKHFNNQKEYEHYPVHYDAANDVSNLQPTASLSERHWALTPQPFFFAPNLHNQFQVQRPRYCSSFSAGICGYERRSRSPMLPLLPQLRHCEPFVAGGDLNGGAWFRLLSPGAGSENVYQKFQSVCEDARGMQFTINRLHADNDRLSVEARRASLDSNRAQSEMGQLTRELDKFKNRCQALDNELSRRDFEAQQQQIQQIVQCDCDSTSSHAIAFSGSVVSTSNLHQQQKLHKEDKNTQTDKDFIDLDLKHQLARSEGDLAQMHAKEVACAEALIKLRDLTDKHKKELHELHELISTSSPFFITQLQRVQAFSTKLNEQLDLSDQECQKLQSKLKFALEVNNELQTQNFSLKQEQMKHGSEQGIDTDEGQGQKHVSVDLELKRECVKLRREQKALTEQLQAALESNTDIQSEFDKKHKDFHQRLVASEMLARNLASEREGCFEERNRALARMRDAEQKCAILQQEIQTGMKSREEIIFNFQMQLNEQRLTADTMQEDLRKKFDASEEGRREHRRKYNKLVEQYKNYKTSINQEKSAELKKERKKCQDLYQQFVEIGLSANKMEEEMERMKNEKVRLEERNRALQQKFDDEVWKREQERLANIAHSQEEAKLRKTVEARMKLDLEASEDERRKEKLRSDSFQTQFFAATKKSKRLTEELERLQAEAKKLENRNEQFLRQELQNKEDELKQVIAQIVDLTAEKNAIKEHSYVVEKKAEKHAENETRMRGKLEQTRQEKQLAEEVIKNLEQQTIEIKKQYETMLLNANANHRQQLQNAEELVEEQIRTLQEQLNAKMERCQDLEKQLQESIQTQKDERVRAHRALEEECAMRAQQPQTRNNNKNSHNDKEQQTDFIVADNRYIQMEAELYDWQMRANLSMDFVREKQQQIDALQKQLQAYQQRLPQNQNFLSHSSSTSKTVCDIKQEILNDQTDFGWGVPGALKHRHSSNSSDDGRSSCPLSVADFNDATLPYTAANHSFIINGDATIASDITANRNSALNREEGKRVFREHHQQPKLGLAATDSIDDSSMSILFQNAKLVEIMEKIQLYLTQKQRALSGSNNNGQQQCDKCGSYVKDLDMVFSCIQILFNELSKSYRAKLAAAENRTNSQQRNSPKTPLSSQQQNFSKQTLKQNLYESDEHQLLQSDKRMRRFSTPENLYSSASSSILLTTNSPSSSSAICSITNTAMCQSMVRVSGAFSVSAAASGNGLMAATAARRRLEMDEDTNHNILQPPQKKTRNRLA